MDPPLRERLSWRNAIVNGIDAPARRAPLAPTAALLFGAAAAICIVGVLVPGGAQRDDGVPIAPAAPAALVAAFLLLGNERVPPWTYHPIGVIGTGVS